jgi:hypothetical protein
MRGEKNVTLNYFVYYEFMFHQDLIYETSIFFKLLFIIIHVTF